MTAWLRHFLSELLRVRIFLLYLAIAIPVRTYGWVDPDGAPAGLVMSTWLRREGLAT